MGWDWRGILDIPGAAQSARSMMSPDMKPMIALPMFHQLLAAAFLTGAPKPQSIRDAKNMGSASTKRVILLDHRMVSHDRRRIVYGEPAQ